MLFLCDGGGGGGNVEPDTGLFFVFCGGGGGGAELKFLALFPVLGGGGGPPPLNLEFTGGLLLGAGEGLLFVGPPPPRFGRLFPM